MQSMSTLTHSDQASWSKLNVQPVVLCVDDEKSILSSLQRVLRKLPITLLVTDSGKKAIDIMKDTQVDLIISDMRMPHMSGAELLTNVYNAHPDTIRVLLTGYSDMDSTIAAINEGKIYRYITKPWSNDDIVRTVSSALEYKHLRDEHASLIELTERQNNELKQLNNSLESKVKSRTAEIANAAKLLKSSYHQLQESYSQTIVLLSHLIEFRKDSIGQHSKFVSQICEKIGRKLEFSDKQMSDLYNAALLHDIGKLCFTEELAMTPYSALSGEQFEQYKAHVENGQMALLSVPALKNTGLIIRAHHEKYDGKGFPDQLSGEQIPIEARVLTIASDFDDLQSGLFLGKAIPSDEAMSYIKEQSGKRYDPKLVEVFESLYEDILYQTHSTTTIKISYADMEPGMTVAKDIISDNGMLLLRSGQTLSEDIIERVASYLQDSNTNKVIHVVPNQQNN